MRYLGKITKAHYYRQQKWKQLWCKFSVQYEINFLNELIKTHWHIQSLAFNATGDVYEPNSCLPEKMSIENPITSTPPPCSGTLEILHFPHTCSPTRPSEGVSRVLGRGGGSQDNSGQNSAEFHAPPPPTIRRPDEDVESEMWREEMWKTR